MYYLICLNTLNLIKLNFLYFTQPFKNNEKMSLNPYCSQKHLLLTLVRLKLREITNIFGNEIAKELLSIVLVRFIP